MKARRYQQARKGSPGASSLAGVSGASGRLPFHVAWRDVAVRVECEVPTTDEADRALASKLRSRIAVARVHAASVVTGASSSADAVHGHALRCAYQPGGAQLLSATDQCRH